MRQTNSRIKKHLKELGYFDFWTVPHTRHSKDMWGLFDCVCKEKTDYGFKPVFCQFKTGYADKLTKEQISEFSILSKTKCLICEAIKRNNKYEIIVKDYEGEVKS